MKVNPKMPKLPWILKVMSSEMFARYVKHGADDHVNARANILANKCR